MKFFKRNSPDIPLAMIDALLESEYGVAGTLTSLESERDQNFRVDARDGAYLFKVCNADEDLQVVELQIGALRHIERVDPSVPVPRSLPTLSGDHISEIKTGAGIRHFVRLMSYQEGVVADRPEYDTPVLRHNTGVTLAHLDRALQGFFHPAASQDHPWDLMRVPRLLDQVDHIPDLRARRKVVSILERVRDHTIPSCLGLRHQVIHQDAHTSNIVINLERPEEIAGIIDFGDLLHGPLIVEVAVAAYLSGRPVGDPTTLIDIVLGYDSVTPLESAEVDVLYDLVLARLAMSTTIAAARAALFPDETHYGVDLELMSQRIEVAVEAAPAITDEIRRVLGFSRQPRNDLATRRASLLGQYSPHFYKEPLHVVAAEGMEIVGADSRRYLDFYNNVPTVGHNHPQVVNAVSRQLATLNTNSRYLYSAVVDYAALLTATLGHDLDVCLFVNSGSEANDVASQILKQRSETNQLLTIEGSYHGMTEASLAITNEDGSTSNTVSTISIDGDRDSLPDSLAGFFVDPALTSNGMPAVEDGLLASLAEMTRARGGLVVADEVQAGFGRTGVMWGHDREGLVPDLVTLGKPVGNGVPLGVVVTRREILDGFLEETGLFSTFGGNPVSCAAGLAVLDVMAREGLVENSATVGAYLRERLLGLSQTHDVIRDVRGTGLLVGLELGLDSDDARALVELMRQAGVLVGAAGRHSNVLKLRPPLIARPKHVDRFVEALSISLNLL